MCAHAHRVGSKRCQECPVDATQLVLTVDIKTLVVMMNDMRYK